MIDDDPDDDEEKLLRAQVPAAMAIRLREHKILTGRTIQTTVNDAIARYLDRVTSSEGS